MQGKTSRALPGIFSMALRNTGRRKTRSLLSAGAIGVAALVMVIFQSLLNGMVVDMQDNIRRWFTADVRIQHPLMARGGADTLDLSIPAGTDLMKALSAVEGVEAVHPRLNLGGSMFVDGDAVFFPVTGLDLATDPMNPSAALGEGDRLPAPDAREALASMGLARKLGLARGERITVVTRTARGSTKGITFEITGILAANMAQFQTPWLWMDIGTARRFAQAPHAAGTLMVSLKSGADARKAAGMLQTALDDRGMGDFAAIPWMETSTTYQFMGLLNLIYGFVGIFFYALASTVVINTMLMVVLERQKEIGTLMALGWDKGDIMRLFLAESVVLSAIGAGIGALAGLGISLILNRTGLDFSEAMQGFTMEVSSIIRPVPSGWEVPQVFLGATLVASAFTLLPLRRILSMRAVDALRGDQ